MRYNIQKGVDSHLIEHMFDYRYNRPLFIEFECQKDC